MVKREILDSLPWASGFARSCAAKFPSYVDREDLQSAGILAYIRAASRYESCLGATFRGYCATRIRGAVLDELRRWTWAPRSVLHDQRRIREAESVLSARLQREPSREELACEMGVAVGEFDSIETHSEYRQVLSLDDFAPSDGTEEQVTLADRIPDSGVASPDQNALTADDRHMLIAAIRDLPKREATVIVLHYLQNVPICEVAKLLHVTPSRVSQLHHLALARMRKAWLQKNAPSKSG